MVADDPRCPAPRYLPGRKPPMLALPPSLSPGQLMALGRVAALLKYAPPGPPAWAINDLIGEIHDEEREADYTHRTEDHAQELLHLLNIGAKAIMAAALLLAQRPPTSTAPTGIGK